jgi:hypothetical protein
MVLVSTWQGIVEWNEARYQISRKHLCETLLEKYLNDYTKETLRRL